MFLKWTQSKLGQSCANSWHKIAWHANRRRACLVLLCATLTPLKQELDEECCQSVRVRSVKEKWQKGDVHQVEQLL